MDIQLNFVNQSNDQSRSDVVIFQKNVATTYEELAIAWRVIQKCGQGDNHPFTFPMTMQVSASDSYGNFTPRMEAQNGQQYAVRDQPSGDVLGYHGPAAGPREVEVLNKLERGAIGANIFKDGKLLAQKTSIAPQQKAVFEFKPTIWIGVASQVVEGKVMNSAVLSDVNTELSLLGIATADIVMTGGGPGQGSTPFEFELDNVVMA